MISLLRAGYISSVSFTLSSAAEKRQHNRYLDWPRAKLDGARVREESAEETLGNLRKALETSIKAYELASGKFPAG